MRTTEVSFVRTHVSCVVLRLWEEMQHSGWSLTPGSDAPSACWFGDSVRRRGHSQEGAESLPELTPKLRPLSVSTSLWRTQRQKMRCNMTSAVALAKGNVGRGMKWTISENLSTTVRTVTLPLKGREYELHLWLLFWFRDPSWLIVWQTTANTVVQQQQQQQIPLPSVKQQSPPSHTHTHTHTPLPHRKQLSCEGLLNPNLFKVLMCVIIMNVSVCRRVKVNSNPICRLRLKGNWDR